MADQYQYNPSAQKHPRVIVTGATGFIGGHVTRYLCSQGVDVSCFARDSSDTGFIADMPARIVRGDITDPQSLADAFRGQQAVVHTAGRVSDWGRYDDFLATNVTGTLNVLQAALDNSISRVIITGSVSSYGEEHHPQLKSEQSPYNSHYPYFLDGIFPSGMNHYRDTKALMTREATEFARKHGINLIILEPVWVYGENESGTGFYDYLKEASRPFAMMPGKHTNTFHVIYAPELARAYYLALTSGLEGVHRFIIGSRVPENMLEIYSTFCREAGFRLPLILPKWVTYPIGLSLELIATLFKAKNPPLLTRARVNMFYDSIGYETSKADEILHFENRVPLEKGVKATVSWYREHGLI
jgi:nucleoside-diphosphate-sugar epimerase